MFIRRAGLLSCVAIMSVGCAFTQPATTRAEGYTYSVGEKAAETALTMVGRPYKFRGDTPSGFDCSGLVRYSYRSAGMNVSHGTSALRQQTRPVPTSDMRKGDLLFFNERGKKYSHVGIYEGDSRFVHAPSSGKCVRVDSLQDPYWKKSFLGARRFT